MIRQSPTRNDITTAMRLLVSMPLLIIISSPVVTHVLYFAAFLGF
jgi:hypothetical protein